MPDYHCTDCFLIIPGSSCAQHGLPEPTRVPVLAAIEDGADAQTSLQTTHTMTTNQHAVTNTLIDAALRVGAGYPECSHAFFIDGPSGNGTTFCYNTIVAALRTCSMTVCTNA